MSIHWGDTAQRIIDSLEGETSAAAIKARLEQEPYLMDNPELIDAITKYLEDLGENPIVVSDLLNGD